MSVEVETRNRSRFLPRGMRRLLGADDPQSSTSAVAGLPNTPVGHVYAMFQGAQNTTIQSPIFNIHAAGTSAGAASLSDSSTLQQSTPSQETLNPTRLIPTSTGVVLPSEPTPVPKTSAEVYVRHLMTMDSGYPLWIPSPSMRLPTSYRASGVSIGDVGVITPEGGFSYLFNVFHDATHPINASMRLPTDFSPFMNDSEMSSSDVDEFKEYSAGSYLADESLVRMDSGDDRFKTILKTSAPHAAVLMMPEAVYASKLQSTVLLRKYIRDNIKSWYRFVKTVLGREVDNGDLRVVYGCRKSTAFGIATVANGGAADASTELTFSVDHSWTEVTGCKYGWHHRGSAVVKSGPSLDENQKIQQERDLATDENHRSAPIINQCLFVSTIDFTLPDGEWERIGDNETVSVTIPDRPNMQSGSTSHSARSPTSPTSIQSNASNSSLSTSGSGNRPGAMYHQSAGILGRPEETESRPTIPPSKRLFHPSDVLAKFLLQMLPQATSVALCSDDWGPYMTSSVQTIAALIDDVLSRYDICEDEGMIYLSLDEGFSPAEHQRSPNVATELLAEGNPSHDSSFGSTRYTDKAIEQRMAISSTFLRPMLLKTPSVNLRPSHVTVRISDIMAVTEGISGNLFQCDMLSTLRVIFPWTRAEGYIVHVSNVCDGNSGAIAHTSTSCVMKFGYQMVSVSKSSPSQVAKIKQNTEIEQVDSEEDRSDLPEPSVYDISEANTGSVSLFIIGITELNYVWKMAQMRVDKKKEQSLEISNDAIETDLSGTSVVLSLVNEAAHFSQVLGLQNAASLALEIVTIIQGIEQNKRLYTLLAKDATDCIASIWRAYQQSSHKNGWWSPSMVDVITELVAVLVEIEEFVEEKTKRGKLIKILSSNADPSQVQEYRQRINAAVKKFELASHLKLNETLLQLYRDQLQIAEHLARIGIETISPAAMLLHTMGKSQSGFEIDTRVNTSLVALASSVVSSQSISVATSPRVSGQPSESIEERPQSPRIVVTRADTLPSLSSPSSTEVSISAALSAGSEIIALSTLIGTPGSKLALAFTIARRLRPNSDNDTFHNTARDHYADRQHGYDQQDHDHHDINIYVDDAHAPSLDSGPDGVRIGRRLPTPSDSSESTAVESEWHGGHTLLSDSDTAVSEGGRSAFATRWGIKKDRQFFIQTKKHSKPAQEAYEAPSRPARGARSGSQRTPQEYDDDQYQDEEPRRPSGKGKAPQNHRATVHDISDDEEEEEEEAELEEYSEGGSHDYGNTHHNEYVADVRKKAAAAVSGRTFGVAPVGSTARKGLSKNTVGRDEELNIKFLQIDINAKRKKQQQQLVEDDEEEEVEEEEEEEEPIPQPKKRRSKQSRQQNAYDPYGRHNSYAPPDPYYGGYHAPYPGYHQPPPPPQHYGYYAPPPPPRYGPGAMPFYIPGLGYGMGGGTSSTVTMSNVGNDNSVRITTNKIKKSKRRDD